MRHDREPRRANEREPAREGEPVAPAAPGGLRPMAGAAAVLALQRSRGNQAVGAILARDPVGAEPMDGRPKPRAPAPATGPRAIVPDIGVIGLLAFSLAATRTRRPPSRGDREADTPPSKDDGELPGGEMMLSSRQGDHSNLLMKWSLDGRAKDVEIIVPHSGGFMRLTLKGAMVSSFSTSDSASGENPIESWTLNFTSMKQEEVKE